MGTWHGVVELNLARHELVVVPSPSGLLYKCRQGCGRQLLVRRAKGGLTILDRGDPWALHVGAIGGIEIGVEVTQP